MNIDKFLSKPPGLIKSDETILTKTEFRPVALVVTPQKCADLRVGIQHIIASASRSQPATIWNVASVQGTATESRAIFTSGDGYNQAFFEVTYDSRTDDATMSYEKLLADEPGYTLDKQDCMITADRAIGVGRRIRIIKNFADFDYDITTAETFTADTWQSGLNFIAQNRNM